MRTVTLGRTGLTVSKTAFGTVPIQRLPEADAIVLLRQAYDGGITFFDTADTYTTSEMRVGKAFEGMMHKITVATKVSPRTYQEASAHIENSLRALKTDCIDLLQLHNPPQCYADHDGTTPLDAALAYQKKGYVRHIGFTSHSLSVAEQAVQSGLYQTLQFPLNALSGPADEALIQACEKAQMGVIAMKPFGGGIIKQASVTFTYFSQHPNVVPIYGMQRQSELRELLELEAAPPLMDAYMKKQTRQMINAIGGQFCRGCGLCNKACPQGIQISSCNRMGDFLSRNTLTTYLTAKWRDAMEKTRACTECGACVQACPYGLDVRSQMRDSYEIFMDLWNRLGDQSQNPVL